MRKRYVIPSKLLPMRAPVLATVAWLVAIDYWAWAGWARGVIYTILAIAWIAWLVSLHTDEPMDLSDDTDPDATHSPSKWQQRMEDIRNRTKRP